MCEHLIQHENEEKYCKNVMNMKVELDACGKKTSNLTLAKRMISCLIVQKCV